MSPKPVYALPESRERAACAAIEQAAKSAAGRGTRAILDAIPDMWVREDAAVVLGVELDAET